METISPLPSPCLLLTATIRVREDIRMTVRSDINTRLSDYKEAFEKWARDPAVASIVFVENSGIDLSPFQEIARRFPDKNVEFLSFECPPFDGLRGGKSYGEIMCFEHCLAHSSLLNASATFLKVTGRFYVANVGPLMDFVSQKESPNAVCNFYRNLTWADSRVFGGSLDLLRRYLCPMKHLIDENNDMGMEQLLARAIHQLMGDGGTWSPTPEALQIEGVSGTLGTTWTPGLLNKFKQTIRHTILLNIMAR
jgi:hypothetical protein